MKNHDKIVASQNEYIKNRIITDDNFRLVTYTRRKIHHALRGSSESSSTKDKVRLDIDTFRKWF